MEEVMAKQKRKEAKKPQHLWSRDDVGVVLDFANIEAWKTATALQLMKFIEGLQAKRRKK